MMMTALNFKHLKTDDSQQSNNENLNQISLVGSDGSFSPSITIDSPYFNSIDSICSEQKDENSSMKNHLTDKILQDVEQHQHSTMPKKTIKSKKGKIICKPWENHEDEILFDNFIKFGTQWGRYEKFLPNRKQHSIKNRFYVILREMHNRKYNGQCIRDRKQNASRGKKPKQSKLYYLLSNYSQDTDRVNEQQSKYEMLKQGKNPKNLKKVSIQGKTYLIFPRDTNVFEISDHNKMHSQQSKSDQVQNIYEKSVQFSQTTRTKANKSQQFCLQSLQDLTNLYNQMELNNKAQIQKAKSEIFSSYSDFSSQIQVLKEKYFGSRNTSLQMDISRIHERVTLIENYFSSLFECFRIEQQLDSNSQTLDEFLKSIELLEGSIKVGYYNSRKFFLNMENDATF